MASNYTVGENRYDVTPRTEAERLEKVAECFDVQGVEAAIYKTGAAICRELETTRELMRKQHREIKYR